MTEITKYRVETRDHWKLALTRWRSGEGAVGNLPVLLLHGLGANRSLFDLNEQSPTGAPALARALARHGYDTWALELRGHGESEVPRWGVQARPIDWCFDDYLNEDLPAAIAFILNQSGASGIHWIGHSMGGLLLLAYASLHAGKPGEKLLRSGVTLGSSLDYSGSRSWFHALLPLRKLARWMPPVPLGPVMRAIAPLGGRVPNPLEGFYYRQSNTEPRVQRAILARSFHVIPVPLLLQLATAFEQGGLCSADGHCRYLDGLRNSQVPIFMAIGENDVQCPPEAGQATFRVLGSKLSRLRIYENYGHFDLLLGKRAHREVFPDLLLWLDQFR